MFDVDAPLGDRDGNLAVADVHRAVTVLRGEETAVPLGAAVADEKGFI